MKKIFFLFYSVGFILCVFSCKNQPAYSLHQESEKYIEEVISLLKTNSVNKNKIDWNTFQKEIVQFAQGSQSVEDTYPAINFAIKKLGDNHSYFTPAVGTENPDNEKPLPVLTDETVPEDIGYIRFPFCIGNEEQAQQYINSITEKFTAQNTKNRKGWIVDLRNNFGGNMWPMLAAAGPLLNNGAQGYFITADNKTSQWKYENGKALCDTTMLAQNHHVVSLSTKNPKIAVLIDNRTASSGEAMAVVFKGLPNVRFFGEKTYGVSTGCNSFTLSDGSRINLATSVFADRNKTKYGESILPDLACSSEVALDKAIEWIQR